MSRRVSGMHLLVVGDSITLGATEVRGDQIVARAPRTYLDLLSDMAPQLRLTADAELNRNSTEAARLLETLVRQYIPDAVLLMIGGNDADLNWKRFVITEGRATSSVVPPHRYGENLRRMIAFLRATDVLPLITDIPRHDLAVRGRYLSEFTGRDVSALLERSGGQSESDKRIAAYRRIADDICREAGCPIVRYGEMMARFPSNEVLGPDGAHPSERGHEIIAQVLYPILMTLKSLSDENKPTYDTLNR